MGETEAKVEEEVVVKADTVTGRMLISAGDAANRGHIERYFQALMLMLSENWRIPIWCLWKED